jgi:dipeptidyl aminopeptidase/acylaminoacyl peptidase
VTASTPVWERRFRAPEISIFDWSPRAADRVVYASTESGTRQIHAFDPATGTRRQVTAHAIGVTDGATTLEGDRVVWFQDETGREFGNWWQQPFTGGDSAFLFEQPLRGWNEGLAQAPGVIAVALSDREGFAVHVAHNGSAPREIHRSSVSVRIGGAEKGGFVRGGLSADGSLLCLEHTERGSVIHPALRVVDSRDGRVVADEVDEGLALSAIAWSPVAGDLRLAIAHEREGDLRPAIWDLEAGTRSDLSLDLPGPVEVLDWWPDGRALLLANLREGRHHLLRYDLSTGDLSPIDIPAGTIVHGRVRPDGSIWYLLSQGHAQPKVLDTEGAEVIRATGPGAPEGRPFVAWSFDNPAGQRVHGLYVSPDRDGPGPVIMLVHGGPTAADTDRWDPEIQAYVDAGFAVGLVNYRGSTGYGREWRDALIGNIGGPELEDVNAGLEDLVRRGVADPRRAVIAGWSWGGYVTLLELGKHPDLWICGVAGIPVGDYEAAWEDLSPPLQAYDRALLGGAPRDVPELMRGRNPIYFVEEVRAPVLLIAGENDSRCPIGQVMPYVEKLRERAHPHRLYTFSSGHGSYDIDEQVRQMELILEFLAHNVAGAAPRTTT